MIEIGPKNPEKEKILMADYNTINDVLKNLSNDDVIQLRVLQGIDMKETTFRLDSDGFYLLREYLGDRLRELRNDLAHISVFVK